MFDRSKLPIIYLRMAIGESYKVIAKAFGVSERTLTRWKASKEYGHFIVEYDAEITKISHKLSGSDIQVDNLFKSSNLDHDIVTSNYKTLDITASIEEVFREGIANIRDTRLINNIHTLCKAIESLANAKNSLNEANKIIIDLREEVDKEP